MISSQRDLEWVIAEARASFYKSPSADPAYEIHYVMGYLKSAYESLYREYKILEKEKLQITSNY